MKNQIKQWLAAPVFPDDEIKTRRAFLLNAALLTIVTLVPVLLLGNALGGRTPLPLFFINGIAIVIWLILIRWLQRGWVGLASYGLMTMGYVLITVSLISLGTIRAPATAMYLLLVITGGLVFDLRGLAISTALCSVLVGGLIVAEKAGWLPAPDFRVSITQWIAYTAIFAWTGSLTFSALRLLRQALVRADHEISERKKIERELRASEELYHALVDTSLEAVLLTVPDGSILSANAAACRMFGMTAIEICQRGRMGVVDASDPRLLAALEERKRTGKFKGELTFIRKDGSKFPGEISSAVFQDFYGRPRTSMIIRDITEHRRAEKALRQANQLLETIFEHTHLMVAYFDPQFNFLRVNHAYAKAEGREPAFFPGKNYFALYPDAENEAIFRRVEETGQPYFAFAKPFEFAEHVERGVTYWDWSLVPIKNPEGATTGLILTLPNVTERLVADQSLRESESKLKAIFENTPIGIAMFDAQGELDEANVELEKITRSSREELLAGGFKKLKLIRLDGSEMLLSEFVKKCAQPENQLEPGVEIGIVTADNQVTWTLVSATQLGPSDNRVVIIMQDITERRQAEELINRAAHEWQATFDATNDAIWILNQDHRILRTNKAATRFFQRGTDQLIGKHCWEIIHNTTQPLPECPMQRALNSFSRETMELQIGENWFQIVVDPIIDKNGRCYSTVHIVRDITESKRVQEELLAKTNKLHGLAAHLQSVREEERTAIAREIHDEFGQVLSALKMNLSIIEREVKKSYPPATPEKILNELDISKEIIGQAVKKVRRLITELRPEVLDIHGLMPALHWQCDEFSFRTKIKCVFKSNVETIEFTEARSIDVFRILQEALNNVAQHAQATKVSVNILKQQNEMVLNIKDNGIGFDVKILDKKLTFGLLGMQERTLLCAGKMEVKSKKGKGTEIEIRIPLGNS